MRHKFINKINNLSAIKNIKTEGKHNINFSCDQ